MKRALFRTRTRSAWPLILRIAAGVVFLAFGAGKFVNHADEVASFDSYGLPEPDTVVYAVGTLDIVGGLALLLGLLTRLAALALAANMAGAIATAGPVEGGPINLVLAPALLIAMLALVYLGPGERSTDVRLLR